MDKGIIYLMTTAVSGLIKIGKTETKSYQERMRFLEANGYYNVVGLKRAFAIEVEDYSDKERLLHEIFSKHQVAKSELFALDVELVKQLLLAFAGNIIYPAEKNIEKAFEEVTKIRKQQNRFSFFKKGLKIGDKIYFIQDTSIIATVVSEREVEFEGKRYLLSPLTHKIFERKGQLTASGAYQGANYFSFNGVKLLNLPDKE